MKYFIITYGCQMNRSDSEKIATRLENAGHKPAKNIKEAEIIAVNFCSVRQSAVHRALDQIHRLRNKKIIVAGCILPLDKKKFSAKNIVIWRPDDYFFQAPSRQNKFSVFVPIMTGCNNFCSYCAVPFTRGREKSRPAKEIITEVKKLLKNGAKEIILLGQNVNSYKSSTDYGLRTTAIKQKIAVAGSRSIVVDFPKLLQLINALPGDFWLSFITSHPKDMSDELIAVMAKCQKIIPYLHLPIQSGDDKILRAMNRRYTVAHYNNLIKKIRSAFARQRQTKMDKSAFSPLAISTDIIVGFPGETKKQFQNTIKLIRDINFDMIYFARYSPRSGTAAARLKDNVSPKEKRMRAQTINSLLKKQALRLNKKYLNKKIEVLIEKIESQHSFGKTITNKSVRFSGKNLKPGQIINAKVIGATAWGLNAVED